MARAGARRSRTPCANTADSAGRWYNPRMPRQPSLTLRLPRPGGLLASPGRNIAGGLLYMTAVMAIATLSYVAAGWSLGDALYMVVITVYTVGFDEVHPIDTPLLRTITICNVVLGCTGMIFLTGALVQFITLNQLNDFLGIKRMNNAVGRLSGHVIVCGFGRIGAQLAQALNTSGTDFVVLERDPGRVEAARALGYLSLQVDATEEAALETAGLLRAKTLATVLPNDAANVFITLSARSLNPAVEIIARGEAPSTESKLLQAGANKVVLPAHIGAERIAEIILHQDLAGLVPGSDPMIRFRSGLAAVGLDMDMVIAAQGSPADGQTVAWVEQQAGGAFFVVQVKQRQGDILTQPKPTHRVQAGDALWLVGRLPAEPKLFQPPPPRPPAALSP